MAASQSANQSLRRSADSKDESYGGCEISPAKSQGTPTSCMYICVVELCERLAFYTFNGSIAFFLERVGFSLVSAGGISACMVTLSFICALGSSWVADVVYGRYKTIVISSVLYIVGSICAATATWPGSENIPLFFLGMLVFIPMATSGIKANLSNLGADQYDESDPVQKAEQERFFSIFYLFINIGSLVAYGFLTTFASNGGFGVPRRFGYFGAYTIAAVCMMVAAGIFIWGSDSYRKVPVQESSAIYSVYLCLRDYSQRGFWQATSLCIGFILLLTSVMLSLVQAFVKTGGVGNALTVAGFLCAGGGVAAIVMPCMNTRWLVRDEATSLEENSTERPTRPGPSDEDIRGFLKLLPVLFIGNIAFNSLYNSMAFWYQQQACQMDLRFTSSIQLSGSFFNVADCIAIILVTPLAVDYVNPALAQRMGGNFGYGPRFGVGMFFGVLSVLIACVIEMLRRGAPVLTLLSQCAPPGVHMSDFASSWMFVPYFLMGVGEIYCNPALMHFAYTRSPASMRTLAAAISFFIQAVSTALFALVLDAVRVFVPNNLNNGHLEYGYLVSIAIGLVFYTLFLKIVAQDRDDQLD